MSPLCVVLAFIAEVSVAHSNGAAPPALGVGDSLVRLRKKAARPTSTVLRLVGVNVLVNDARTLSSSLLCEQTHQVTKTTDKDAKCPTECPYFAQDKADDLFCSFRCVPGYLCSENNPLRPIPDTIKGQSFCRAPFVIQCKEHHYDGTDTCKECNPWFRLNAADGQCYRIHRPLLIAVALALVLFATIVIVWLVDLCRRPVCNKEQLDRALHLRSSQKLHMEADEFGERQRYDGWSTNMCQDLVAGPGMLLHFNFQVFVIIMAAAIGVLWFSMAYLVDNDLLTLGTNPIGPPRENCIVVAWGWHNQQRLMDAKVIFLAVVYFGTFIACLLFGVRQRRVFVYLDKQTKSMADFAAKVKGIPEYEASDPEAENKVKELIFGGAGVVGVSIAWSFRHVEQEIEMYLEQDLSARELEKDEQLKSLEEQAEPEYINGIRRRLYNLEKKMFEAADSSEEEVDKNRNNIKQILNSIKSSDEAFVIFNTEEERDTAVQKAADGQLTHDGKALELTQFAGEPKTINWANFGHFSDFGSRMKRLAIGVGMILLALLFWVCVFYAPYAWSLASFDYAGGRQPPFVYGLAFTMVVVVGNAIMYLVCAMVADYIGYKFKDDRESCYMILYTVACLLNVAMDGISTYFMALQTVRNMGFRTHEGEHLREVEGFEPIFETYAMQRWLGQNVYAYAFPSTFLIPFLIEPVATVIAPLKIGELIVRSHPKIRGRAAEAQVEMAPFDFGRYADIMLNVMLAVLIFFFPGGYTAPLFFWLAVAHCWIYVYDKWKVLNAIPTCTFAGYQIEWWAQAMFAPVVATILSAVVYKANCTDHGFCFAKNQLVETCACFWLGHVTTHILLLLHFVPWLARKNETQLDAHAGMTYEQVARTKATSWFNANPIHAVRSKEVHMHEPSLMRWNNGKEHLQELNTECHSYYTQKKIEAENYDTPQLADMKKVFSGGLVGKDPAPKK